MKINYSYFYALFFLFTVTACKTTELYITTDFIKESDNSKIETAIKTKKIIRSLYVSNSDLQEYDPILLKKVLKYPRIKESRLFITDNRDFAPLLDLPNIYHISLSKKQGCEFPAKLWDLPKLITLSISFKKKYKL